jgi:hypothetical protein
MANYYTQFSLALPLADNAQKAWAKEVVDIVDEFCDDPDGFEASDDPLGILVNEHGEAPDWLGLDATVDEDGLWIHSEESGSPERVVQIIQAFLKKFDPDGRFGFEWANTCSKPRLDAFSGGAVFITAHDADWNVPSQWLAEKLTQ